MKLEGFSGYEIYPEEGKVWSYKSNRFVGSKNPKGYWYVSLIDDNRKQHTFILSRLIWESVYGKIPEGYEVNHTTEDKNMNGIQFLSLCTHKENCNFGTAIQRSAEKRSRQVGAFKDGVLVLVFSSTSEAERSGYDSGHIVKCCNNIRKSHKGYQWKYLS